MKLWLCVLTLIGPAIALHAQPPAKPPAAQRPQAQVGPVQGEKFTTQYIRLGQGEGLLYEPVSPGAKARIALVFTHPGDDNFTALIGRELVSRGYLVMNVNYRGSEALGNDFGLPTVSLAIGYLRTLPGVQKVVISGHSGGAHTMALYENIAEHGVAACNGPEKIYPCRVPGLDHLQKPDGLILLDPPLGNFHQMSAIDPAVTADVNVRNPALDMFSAANGFDAAAGRATYSPDFAKRFYAAQSARNMLHSQLWQQHSGSHQPQRLALRNRRKHASERRDHADIGIAIQQRFHWPRNALALDQPYSRQHLFFAARCTT